MKKIYRIKKTWEIGEILKNKEVFSNSYFIIYLKEQNEAIHFRYAVSVGKKIGNAVTRNKVKRQIRAIVRELEFQPQYKFLIVARPNVNHLTFEQMKDELIFLLKKTKKLFKGGKNDTFSETK